MIRWLTQKRGSEVTEVEHVVFTTPWNREGGFKAFINARLVDHKREDGEDDGVVMRLTNKLVEALRDSPAIPSCMMDRKMKPGPLDQFVLAHRGLGQDISPSMIVHCSKPYIEVQNKLYRSLTKATKATGRFSRSLVAILLDQPNAIQTAQDVQANSEKLEHLECWFSNLGADFDKKHVLVAFTASEFKELNGACVDVLYSMKNEYQVPPPSRATSEAGDEDTAIDQYLTDYCSNDQRSASKDLRRILAPKYGFCIVNDTTNDNTDTPADNSDYYGLPLIENEQKWPSNKVKTFSYNDIPIKYNSDDTVCGIPREDELRLIDELGFEAPLSQYPGQALALHLIFKGVLPEEVCATLGGLEREFVFGTTSRWWSLSRVPEHSQLNDNIVKVLLKLAKAKPRFWELEHDLNGVPIPHSMRDFHLHEQDLKITRMVQMCLENYFFWRLKGHVWNPNIINGSQLRPGEW